MKLHGVRCRNGKGRLCQASDRMTAREEAGGAPGGFMAESASPSSQARFTVSFRKWHLGRLLFSQYPHAFFIFRKIINFGNNKVIMKWTPFLVGRPHQTQKQQGRAPWVSITSLWSLHIFFFNASDASLAKDMNSTRPTQDVIRASAGLLGSVAAGAINNRRG